MTKGGARPRAGRPADPNSERTRKAAASGSTTAAPVAFSPTALPSEGHRGRAPAFPLPLIKRFGLDGVNQADTKSFRSREIAIWREVWKTPQAAAWSREPWRWPTIGEFCRVKAAVELDAGGNAALVSRLREYRNEVGLSPDGLKMNGWAIAPNQVALQAAKKAAAPTKKTPPARRLRSVGGKAGA